MSYQDSPQKRRYFRLRYEKKELMPDLHMFDMVFRVSELSEHGIRVLMGETAMTAKRTISGYLHLHSSDKIYVKGHVLRKEKHETVFELTEGPSFKEMIEEQRYMRQHHPEIFPKKSDLAGERYTVKS